jgi:hypothetical protein
VENKNSKHGGNSQPIDVVPPLIHGCVSCSISILSDSFTSWAFDDIWPAAAEKDVNASHKFGTSLLAGIYDKMAKD